MKFRLLLIALLYGIILNAQTNVGKTTAIPMVVLEIKQTIQERDQWCWAATSKAILDYYCSPISQCEVANFTRFRSNFPDVQLGSVDCCNPTSTRCNVPNYNWGGAGSIQDILKKNADIDNDPVVSCLKIEDIQHYILNRQPFVIRIGYNSGGGHFIVGAGYANNMIYVMNPWPGEGLKVSDYEWFKSNNEFSWKHTNTLRKSAPENKVGKVSIQGPTKVCTDEKQIKYVLNGNTTREYFVWKLPNGETVSTDQDTIVVDMTKAITGKSIMAMPLTECIQRDMVDLTVSLIKKPAKPTLNSIDDALVSNISNKYNYWYQSDNQDAVVAAKSDSVFKPDRKGVYFVKAIIEDCESEPSDLIGFLKSQSSVNMLLSDSKVNIYPNPTSDFVNVEIDDLTLNLESLMLFDINGKMVLNNAITEKAKTYKIDMTSLGNGIYALKAAVDGEDVEFKNKIIKN